MKKEYEVGDNAWIYLSTHKGELTKSEVVHKFTLYGGKKFYVCEIPTPVDPLLEVRDWFSMAETEHSGIGFDQMIRKVK